MNKLPSLNALRAFAAAGRHLNLNQAAQELHVTASALSHQIRGLEEHLNTRLFERTSKGLKLTAAGQLLLPGISEAFAGMRNALDLLQPEKNSNILTVSMLSTFAMRWFIPRLSRFQQAHPDIEIRITTSVECVDFSKEQVDCAIRCGSGQWAGLTSHRLFAENFTPVCSPSLASGEKPLNTPDDLQHHTLLHARLRPDDWNIWLHSAGVGKLKAAHDLVFETRNFAMQAAIDGLGVAIINPSLAAEAIRNGRLIQPFETTIASTDAYYLVYPQNKKDNPALADFRTWLQTEAAH